MLLERAWKDAQPGDLSSKDFSDLGRMIIRLQAKIERG